MVMFSKLKKSKSPLKTAIVVMVCSIIMSGIIFKSTATSWLSFVTVLTFSSGMMTLFVYAASASPEEKVSTVTKESQLVAVLLMVLSTSSPAAKTMKTSMATFTSKAQIFVLTMVLLVTVMVIGTTAFNPNQSLSSSF